MTGPVSGPWSDQGASVLISYVVAKLQVGPRIGLGSAFRLLLACDPQAHTLLSSTNLRRFSFANTRPFSSLSRHSQSSDVNEPIYVYIHLRTNGRHRPGKSALQTRQGQPPQCGTWGT